MHKKIKLVFCTLFISLIHLNAQIVLIDKNVIIEQAHLSNFYKKLDNKSVPIKILHLGDSHIMMGHFANEIRRSLDSAIGINSYGWVFPNQIGRFNTFYTKSKTISGRTSFANNLEKEVFYQNGIAGQSIQFLDKVTSIEFSLKNLPSKFLYFNKLKLLYQNNKNLKINVSVYDSSNKLAILTDTMSNERAINSKYANNVNVSAFNFNNNYNKIKITVEKKDSSDIFNLLGIYLDNKDEKRIVYNSLGVGGSSLYSITDHNSLLVDNISNYGPDLIILSFGSNDAYYKNFDSNNYNLKLVEFIKKVSSKNPNTTFLLTSPPDSRSKNREPVSLPAIQQIFSEIAETQNNVAYWDLRSIMGGENSVNNWLKYKLAENDKLHYTKAGYDLQAQLLIKALLKY